jgi:hypothetical protein
MERRLSRWLPLLAVLASLLAGCRARHDVVATLSGYEGQVQRDRLAEVGKWKSASIGAEFVIGDGVRTGARSTAALRLFEKDQLSLEPNTVLRFLDRPSRPGQARVALELGQVTLQAAEGVLELETELGTARIAPHGQMRLTKTGSATQLEVTIGSAEVLRNGEHWKLDVGDAMDVRFESPLRHGTSPASPASSAAALSATPPTDSASPAPAHEPDEKPADGKTPGPAGAAVARLTAGPARVDLLVHAGDSIVIHDPHPPAAVGIPVSSCAAGAVLTVDPTRSTPRETSGTTQVSAELGPGSHRYVVRCLNAAGERAEKVAEGTISVIADAGVRQLAKTAPATEVDTDGRRYTVLYQSVLPRISVRWPEAPAAPGYELHVSSASGTRTFSTSRASHAFAAGALAEGDHVVSFEAAGRRSPSTQIAIRFDNAAPTASIASPAEGSFGAGQAVLVAGAALPGWTVSVGGETLTQDAQNRFSATLAAPAGLGALAIRFARPERGVHYYLRRCAR